MTNPNEPVNPSTEGVAEGLTKREYFAAMAMQGLMPVWVDRGSVDIQTIASTSIEMADALIAELNK